MTDLDFFKNLAMAMVQSGAIKLGPIDLSNGVMLSEDKINEFYNAGSIVLIMAELACRRLEIASDEGVETDAKQNG
nr:MAG TPA: hypothetical protein [Caudoviricetes sp.]